MFCPDFYEKKVTLASNTQFKAKKMKETLQEISKSFQEDLWAVSLKDVQKVLQGTIIEHERLRSIILFCLNKIPRRNACCLKCKVGMNLYHFVECKKKYGERFKFSAASPSLAAMRKKKKT